MKKLTYLQIEITGNCRHHCRICLPPEKRTRIDMTTADAECICMQAECAGVSALTVTGFGNPVAHPKYAELMKLFTGKFTTTVTCRPEDLGKVGSAHRVNVSVRSLRDAEMLVDGTTTLYPPTRRKIVPHLVLTRQLRAVLGPILRVLISDLARWERVTVASPVVLCDDPLHRMAVSDANYGKSDSWGALRRMLRVLPAEEAGKFELCDYRPRKADCAWIKGGLLVNGRMDVLPCCNLPRAHPIGNLKQTTLEEIVERFPHAFYSALCDKCPDTGDRT